VSSHCLLSLSAACLALSLACASGCGSESGSSTTGKRIVLHTVVGADSVIEGEFTTGFGWDVQLTRAKVAISAFYYFDGPPPTASFKLPQRGFGERLANYFIGTAWAHPGHYQAGTALGEAIFSTPVAYDLFSAAPVHLSDGDGVTGIYRSGRFVLPQTAPADPVLDGHLAIAEGKAVKHGDASAEPIYFRLVADYDDISMSVNEGAVDGCVLDETTVTSDGTITVTVKPTVWLNLVDFSKIEPGKAGNPSEARSSGFSQGVTQLSAYHFRYSDSL